MPVSSGWPLSADGIRFFVPKFLVQKLANHPLSQGLYPNGMGYYPNAEGHLMERTAHEDHLLMYCAQGKGQLFVNDQLHDIESGELMLLPKGLPHKYWAAQQDPWSLYWVHFDGQQSQAFVDFLITQQRTHQKSGDEVIRVGRHPKIIADFEQLLETRQTGYSFTSFLHSANHRQQILSYLAVLIPKASPHTGNPIDLDKIHTIMQEGIYGKLNLETLAASVNLSKFHFSKRYKALTGQSPIQHFIHLKMEKACYLLDISNKPIGEIGSLLSYEDTHYFSRLFKQVIGLSPREYRQLKRG